MSGATFIAPIVVEHAHSKDSTKQYIMEAQMWLGPSHILSAQLQYFNKYNLTFTKPQPFLAVIHIASAVSLSRNRLMNDSSSSQGSNSSSSHSPLDDFDLCGDVVIMFSISVDDVKRSPYCELSGNSVNCNKTERTFQLRVNQYTSFNRPNPPHPPHSPSPLTFCARFDPARYKVKAPMPSDNSGVVVHGFVNDVERVPLGKHPTVFTFDVDQITFIGRTPVPAPVSSSVPLPSPSQGRFKFQYDTLLDSTSFPPSDISNNSFQSDNKTIEHRSQPSTPSHSTVEEHNLEEKRAGKRPRFD